MPKSRNEAGSTQGCLSGTRTRSREGSAGSAVSRAARGGAAKPPPCAARGASPRPVTTGGKSGQAAIVDWLNVTCDYTVDISDLLEQLSLQLGGLPTCWNPQHGMHGFEHGMRLTAYAGGQLIPFGSFSWGGESQRGRCLLQIEGGGCRLVEDWNAMAAWLKTLPAMRITRCDLAVDLHEGEYTVDDCADWARAGKFTGNGRPPRLDTQGDWLTNEHGRTLYVGRAANGKMLRCYEKGKQLGDLASEWVRFEVQFGNRDRDIPLSILTERDAFFAGAYPALEDVLGVVGDKIATTRTTSAITVARAVEHLRRSYGKWINFIHSQGIESADLVDAVRVRAVPSRLNLASVADAGLSATVHAVFSERKRNEVRSD